MLARLRLGAACHAGSYCESGLEPFLEAPAAKGDEGWLTAEQDRVLQAADAPEALLALHTHDRDWLRAHGP